jgi:hypothetical protein
MPTTMPRLASRTSAVIIVAMAGLLLSGCSLVNQITNTTPRDPSGTATAANRDADVFSIRVGDCLNDATATGTVTTAPIVPCAQPHDSEVFTGIVMKGSTFPGKDAVTTQAQEDCADAFPDFVGISYDDSDLNVSFYYPTADSWANGDREILCTVSDKAGKTTGTLKGAAR